MTTNEFLERARDLYGQAEKELQFKAQDYQGAYENAFDGIEGEARDLGVDPKLLIMVGLNKHVHAIRRFVKDGHLESEHIWSRLRDAINYCVIMQIYLEHSEGESSRLLEDEPDFTPPPDPKPKPPPHRIHGIGSIPHVFQEQEGNSMCAACNLAPAAKVHCVDLRPPGTEPGPGGLNVESDAPDKRTDKQKYADEREGL